MDRFPDWRGLGICHLCHLDDLQDSVIIDEPSSGYGNFLPSAYPLDCPLDENEIG